MPPTAPSFAERLSIDRPRTAPSTKTAFYPPPPPPPPKSADRLAKQAREPARRSEPVLPTTQTPIKQQAVRASAFHSHPPRSSPKIIDNSVDVEVPLAPPLPLILRPPLRKKKSFSRVSNWLFPAGVEHGGQQGSDDEDEGGREGSISPTGSSARGRPRHRRDISSDSVTNAPRALTDKEGYYQTLPPSALFSGRRSSFDSMSDVLSQSQSHTESIYSTDEETYLGRRAGTTTATSTTRTHWSPANTPPEAARRQLGCGHDAIPTPAKSSAGGIVVGRTGTFGSDALAAAAVVQGPPSPVEEALKVPVEGPRPTSVGVAF